MYQVLVDKQICLENYRFLCNTFCLREIIICFSKTIYLLIYWTSNCFVLFEVIFLLKLISLLSKSVLVTKLACFNLVTKFSAVNLSNSWVVIYLTWSGIYSQLH